jgi:hypothetical protein
MDDSLAQELVILSAAKDLRLLLYAGPARPLRPQPSPAAHLTAQAPL